MDRARCYQLGLYEKSMPNELSLREKLEEGKRAGFDYLELSIDETDEKLLRLDWNKEQVDALLADIREVGLPIKSICLSGHRKFPLGSMNAKTRSRSLEIMDKAIGLAAALGVRLIQLAGYDVHYEESCDETRRLFGENLELSVRMAAREGVMLGFETMETPFMDTVAKAMHWVDRIHSPYLQVYPDIGNLTNAALVYQGSITEDMKLGTGHLAAVHLKETVPGVYREVPYGTGHVDFQAAVQCAFDLGVRMFVGEFWYVGQEDWRETLKQNNIFLRKVLDA